MRSILELKKRIFIIGGGPSVKDYDKDLLEKVAKEDVLSTNNSYILFPESKHLHFADKVWWDWNRSHVMENFRGPITTSAVGTTARYWENQPVTWLRKKADTGISMDGTTLCGNNAGHQALNLAILWGYKEIYLLGFDMKKGVRGETHWHKLHKRETRISVWRDTMIPGFKTIPESIKQHGLDNEVSVFNCSMDSALEMFPKIELGEIV